MERKKTSPIVYILLIAIIGGLSYFIFQRVRQNIEDRKVIDKTLNSMRQDEAKAMSGK